MGLNDWTPVSRLPSSSLVREEKQGNPSIMKMPGRYQQYDACTSLKEEYKVTTLVMCIGA